MFESLKLAVRKTEMFESLKLAARELSQKVHFWVLVALGVSGEFLDVYTTFVGISRGGYLIEGNQTAAIWFQRLDFLGLFSSILMTKIILFLEPFIVFTVMAALGIFWMERCDLPMKGLKLSWKICIYAVVGCTLFRLLVGINNSMMLWCSFCLF